MVKLPKFEGKPLNESVDFLRGDFGKAVYKEYNRLITYGERSPTDVISSSALDVLSYEKGVVKGSNPFAAVVVEQIIEKEGFRVAKPTDLEKILKTNTLDLKGYYEDSALILRDEGEPNSYLARDLMKQVRQRDSKITMPVMIPLCGLELEYDSSSFPYRLSFKLKENAEVIYAPVLNKRDKRFLPENINKETGLPEKFSKKGERILHNGRSGLSLLRLGNSLNLYSDTKFFDHSGNEGRIIVVKER